MRIRGETVLAVIVPGELRPGVGGREWPREADGRGEGVEKEKEGGDRDVVASKVGGVKSGEEESIVTRDAVEEGRWVSR